MAISFIEPENTDDRSLHCGNRDFGLFWLLDLHDNLNIRTSYAEAFESYRLTDRHIDTRIHTYKAYTDSQNRPKF